MKKLVIYIFVLGCSLFSVTHNTNAANQFEFDYTTTYKLAESLETEITHNVVVTNKQNDVIATSYSLVLGQQKITDVKVTSGNSNLKYVLEEGPTSTEIKVEISDQMVGDGKKNNIQIQFKSQDFLRKNGSIWTFTTPSISSLDNANTYNVKLLVPKSFGDAMYVAPKPETQTQEEDFNAYLFEKKQLHSQGITASFGKHQYISFNLKYHLKNNSNLYSTQKIALPPEIKKYQQLSYTNIDPKPKSIFQDKDDNIIAQYTLNPKNELRINVSGTAKIYVNQIDLQKSGSSTDIPGDFKVYTSSQKYWEATDSEFLDLAKKLSNTNQNILGSALNIYKHTVEYQRLDKNLPIQENSNRKGGLAALNNPVNWGSLDFTDFYITLARAAQIPARKIDGYMLNSSSSGDTLHTWPEFYDQVNGWVQVDPTWGRITGLDYFSKTDTNRLALAIQGTDSQLPLPAGAYRFEDDEKQIDIKFLDSAPENPFVANLEIKQTFGFNFLKILSGYRPFNITNKSGVVLYNFNNSGFNIMPFESKKVYLKFPVSEWFFYDFNDLKITREI